MTSASSSLHASLVAAPPAAAGDAARARPATSRWGQVLAACYDPEWLLFTGFLLVPVLGFALAGSSQRASFFFGAMVYLGVLKWIGWLALGRLPGRAPAYARFPAEVLAGLGILAFWFYARNLLGSIWPGSYSLRELAVLPWLVVALHVAGGLRLLGARHGALVQRALLRATLLRRAGMYVPFCFVLLFVLWNVSSVVHVQATDSITHGFTARVYAKEGLFYCLFGGTQPILYPSGFGALNAVAVAASPLNAVQAVNLQHVVLLILACFLISGTVVLLANRDLWLVHALVLPFLSLFPLYCLYPDICYESTGRQAAPALLAAICLSPLLIDSTRAGRVGIVMAVESILGGVAATLNPACVPYAAGALILAWSVHAARRADAGISWGRLACRLVLAVALPLLIVASDPYYRYTVAAPLPTEYGKPSTPEQPANPVTLFKPAKAFQALGAVHPFDFSPAASTVVVDTRLGFDPNWPHQMPQRAVCWIAFACAAGTFVLYARVRRRPGLPASAVSLLRLTGGCVAVWLLLKYGMTAVIGGLSEDTWLTRQLGVYLGFLLLRGELLLILTILLAAGTAGLLLAGHTEQPGRRTRFVRATVVPLLGGLCYTSFWLALPGAGPRTMPTFHYGGKVGEDDLRLVEWLDQHISAEQGLIGLAAGTYRFGLNKAGQFALTTDGYERHMYPWAGSQAVVLYGQHWNFCFTGMDPYFPRYAYDDYLHHVRDTFDAAWCLRNNVRYLFVPRSSLEVNPGLARAINERVLRPIRREGESCVYEVVSPSIP